MMHHLNNTNLKAVPSVPAKTYQHLDIQIEKDYGLAWYYMHAQPRPCFTLGLLGELKSWYCSLNSKDSSNHDCQIHYIVAASSIPGIFNLGGDLHLFAQLIRSQDRQKLLEYALACIDVLYINMVDLLMKKDITTISLVQGDALGGGFEGALSSNVLIAEKQSKMGLPEILFNLFPGMGAYSMLSRKIGQVAAEKMILSGKLYTASELHDMGVVDILVDEGQGELAVYDYIRKEERSRNGYRALRKAKELSNPVTREELENITKVWVDAALNLTEKDLNIMNRLVMRQTSKIQ